MKNERTVTITLNWTYGYGRPTKYYGPGTCEVPSGLARSLGLLEHDYAPSPSSPDSDALQPTQDLLNATAEVADTEGDGSLPPSAADDLTEIAGIGPAYAEKLAAAGITTFKDLAEQHPDVLAQTIKVKPHIAQQWKAAAWLLNE